MDREHDQNQDPLGDVVRRCQGGDRAAQKELYDQSQRDVYRLMVRMVGRQDAADVTQQVFLQAFRKLDQFRGESKFKTWLYRLAVNESLQYLRKNRRNPDELAYDPVDHRVSVATQAEAEDLLTQALDRLDPLLRSVFLLKESEGLSYREIASATDIPEGTVGSRLNRARRQLREALIELGWEA